MSGYTSDRIHEYFGVGKPNINRNIKLFLTSMELDDTEYWIDGNYVLPESLGRIFVATYRMNCKTRRVGVKNENENENKN